MNIQRFVPHICLTLYIITAIWSGIHPFDTTTWIIELITSAVPVILLIILYNRGIRFSALSYIIVSVFPIMHAIGSHYTFANVPSQWLSDLLHTDRNMYDRIAHMAV